MNILEYNKRCAEFLGARFFNATKDYELYGVLECIGDGENEERFFTIQNMKFHSDWNWIMEIVTKIQSLAVVHDNTRTYDSVFKEWICTFSPSFKTHDFGYIEGKSKASEKEAVVQAIDEFLIWMNENKETQKMDSEQTKFN